ncbi:ethionine resistance protein [Coemansia sp. RSA 1285]|nr:ethionine resistance protein [Coemansia sp. RSA 1285]
MAETSKSQQTLVQEADERCHGDEATPLLQTSLSELDISIAKRDTVEPYFHAARNEIKWMASSSSLTILTNVLQTSFMFVNVVSVGHLGAKELGAMSLAVTLQGIFAFAPIFGLLSAMDTFCSTAYTASRDKRLVGFHYQRGIIAVLTHFAIISPIMWNAERLLLFLGQDPEIAHLVGMYLRLNIVGMLPYSLFETTKRFLQAQGIMRAATIVIGVVAPIHWTSSIILVRSKFGPGFIGVPVVNIITNYISLTGILLYTRNSRAMEAWGGWKISAFHNMRAYYRLAIPSVVTTCADWVCFELLTFGTSYFGATQLAGSAIMLNTVQVVYQFSNGLGFGTSPRIGNLIGAAKPRQTRIAADMAILTSALIGIIGAVFLTLCGDWWISIYTNDPVVARQASRLVLIVCVFSLCNGLNAVLSSVLRGLGRQKASANIFLSGFYICGLPTGIYFAAESIFLALGQDPEIAYLVGLYLRINSLRMLQFSLYETTKRFLQAQRIMYAATVVISIVIPIQWVSNIVLVRSERFGLRFVGVPIVNIISNWLVFIVIIIYIRYSRAREAWGGWRLSAFHNMWAFYSLAIPSVITCCADWVCFELLIIGAPYFGAHQLAGTAIMNNTIQVLYQFSNGLGIGTSPRIGSLIGAAKPRQTHIASDMAILASALLGLAGVLLLSLCGDWWIPVYTNDLLVAVEAAKLVLAICLYSFGNGLNAVLSAVMRGIGRQKISANILFFGVCVCGLPIAVHLAYVRGLESAGLWWGACTGAVVSCIIKLFYMSFIVDWKDEVRLCLIRLKNSYFLFTSQCAK